VSLLFARIHTFTDGLEQRLDDGIVMFRDTFVPQLEKHCGFSGAAFLADREGEAINVITLWNTEEDMIATAELDRRLTDAAARELGLVVETSICEVA
jgi:heme-degrading monooxygenase HmoA